jgi:hypothetical protein
MERLDHSTPVAKGEGEDLEHEKAPEQRQGRAPGLVATKKRAKSDVPR